MADFEIAFKKLLKDEGGYSDNPSDPGGPTNLGISLRFLKERLLDVNNDGAINKKDVQDLTLDSAKKIYKEFFWDNIDEIKSQEIADMLFGLRVNMGPVVGTRLLQQAANILPTKLSLGFITEDGMLGPRTIYTINLCNQNDLLKSYKQKALLHYKRIVYKNPTSAVFMRGWENRVNSY